MFDVSSCFILHVATVSVQRPENKRFWQFKIPFRDLRLSNLQKKRIERKSVFVGHCSLPIWKWFVCIFFVFSIPFSRRHQIEKLFKMFGHAERLVRKTERTTTTRWCVVKGNQLKQGKASPIHSLAVRLRQVWDDMWKEWTEKHTETFSKPGLRSFERGQESRNDFYLFFSCFLDFVNNTSLCFSVRFDIIPIKILFDAARVVWVKIINFEWVFEKFAGRVAQSAGNFALGRTFGDRRREAREKSVFSRKRLKITQQVMHAWVQKFSKLAKCLEKFEFLEWFWWMKV